MILLAELPSPCIHFLQSMEKCRNKHVLGESTRSQYSQFLLDLDNNDLTGFATHQGFLYASIFSFYLPSLKCSFPSIEKERWIYQNLIYTEFHCIGFATVFSVCQSQTLLSSTIINIFRFYQFLLSNIFYAILC